jgi:hypothetical protein
MLSEGTLLSGGEKDRKIIAWDTLQNYKKITETKVNKFIKCYNLHLKKKSHMWRNENCLVNMYMHPYMLPLYFIIKTEYHNGSKNKFWKFKTSDIVFQPPWTFQI